MEEKEFDIPAIYIVALLVALVIGAFVISGFHTFSRSAVELAAGDRPVPRSVWTLSTLLIIGTLFGMRYYYHAREKE